MQSLSNIQRRFGRVTVALALVVLVILGSVAVAYANSQGDSPTAPQGGDVVLPVEPDGGIGGDVVLPVEPDGGIGN
jgi:hypothetical protein